MSLLSQPTLRIRNFRALVMDTPLATLSSSMAPTYPVRWLGKRSKSAPYRMRTRSAARRSALFPRWTLGRMPVRLQYQLTAYTPSRPVIRKLIFPASTSPKRAIRSRLPHGRFRPLLARQSDGTWTLTEEEYDIHQVSPANFTRDDRSGTGTAGMLFIVTAVSCPGRKGLPTYYLEKAASIIATLPAGSQSCMGYCG